MAVLVGTTITIGGSVEASASAVTITGDLGALPAGSATIEVMVHTPESIDASNVPGRFTDIEVPRHDDDVRVHRAS
ncbi:MAG TPA: hypothetical protein VGS21_01460 [Acidimicrobiales bacterium]|nr:hypothetical protein [Acidimicrobiales bacterium]